MKQLTWLVLLAAAWPAVAQPPTPDHIVIVIEENHSDIDVIGNPDAVYMNWLAQHGALLTNSYGLVHPSQPNYLHLFSGDDQGSTDDTPPTSPYTTPNLGAELMAAGRTFVGYSEDLPAVGSLVTSSGAYFRKHNPWSDWQAAVPGPNQLSAAVNRPFTDFPSDFSQLPTVSIVVPNQINDMHDGTVGQADDWLESRLGAYAQWALDHNSLLIVTWDEDSFAARNHIPTILYGAMVRSGNNDGRWTHHNLLRTIEDMYGTLHAGGAAGVRPIVGPFSTDPAATHIYFRQGDAGYVSAHDTWIESANPALAHAADTTLVIDGSPSSQGLVRFDDIFGPSGIPAGATILSAKLTLYTGATTSDASVAAMDLYRLARSFTDASTWNSLAAGISPGSETLATPDFTFKPRNNSMYVVFDVTSSLEAWQAGSPMYGWAVIPTGTDGWRPVSNEGTLSDRPRLDVTYTMTSCSADFDHDGDTGTDFDIQAFFACLGGNCCAMCGSADFDNDGDVGTDFDIESFFRVLGGGPC